ncbi:lactonase family protein [Latilactobacillus graminis]|nr:lactonase family protein [Latilactobacillus graminis]QFP79984.1 lactonase family protein [Latilactobacillus graminis]
MTEQVLIGGYTRRVGKGIYRGIFDATTATVSDIQPYIKLDNASYLAISKRNILYTVIKDGEQGGIAAYDLTQDSPTFLNAVLAVGAPPAYVAIDEERQLVYAANYHKGEILVYRIQADGRLALASTTVHEGHGPRPEQASAHVHYTDLTPDKRLVVCDLGTDELTTYSVDDTGQLTQVATYKSTPGFGTRHLVFHPNHKTAYLLGELSSEVTVLEYHATDGSFTALNTYSMLPNDWHKANGGAAIRVSKDGNFLYASNRGYNSIVVYAISEDRRRLREIQQMSTDGEFPRDFNLSADDSFLLAVNQNSDNGTLYRRDAVTGLLSACQKGLSTPEGVCVLFH